MRNFLFLVVLLWSLKSFGQSKLIFTYDSAGNQIRYKYCEKGDCKAEKPEETKEKEKKRELLQQHETLEDPVATNSEINLILYPNPTYGILHMEWEVDKKRSLSKIVLTDVTGHTLKTAQHNNNTAVLQLNTFPVGVYFVKFLFSDNTVITKKIIKK